MQNVFVTWLLNQRCANDQCAKSRSFHGQPLTDLVAIILPACRVIKACCRQRDACTAEAVTRRIASRVESLQHVHVEERVCSLLRHEPLNLISYLFIFLPSCAHRTALGGAGLVASEQLLLPTAQHTSPSHRWHVLPGRSPS
jgi:hypothetical protein